jgi:hypothetical protein
MKTDKKTVFPDPSKVFTYVESGVPDLEAGRTRLLFAAWFSHGPGFQENLLYFVGPSKCKRYDVLWSESDWDDADDGGRKASAWIEKGQLSRRKLWETLLTKCWKAEKAGWGYEKPLFDEVSFDKRSLLSSEEVWEMADRIWPPK